MKKLFLLTLLAFSISAHASILLTTPFVVSGPAGMVGAGTATNATMTSKTWNPITSTYLITWGLGTVTTSGAIDTGFTVFQGAPTVTVTLNTVTGLMNTYVSTGGQVYTKTFTGTALSNLITALSTDGNSLRDGADAWAIANIPFLAGTQPDTW